MIDYYIQLFAKIVLMGFSASYYHVIYFMLDYIRDDINNYYKLLKNPVMIITLLFVAYEINKRGSKMNGIFDVILYYSIVVYVIMNFGTDSRYLLLGVSTAFFLSEYWETPIYLWQIFIKGTYVQYDPLYNVYLIIKYFLKILTIVYVKRELNFLGLVPSNFLSDLVKFSIIYIPTVFLFFTVNSSNLIRRNNLINLFHGMDFNWVFRLLCFGIMLQYLYKERGNNIILS